MLTAQVGKLESWAAVKDVLARMLRRVVLRAKCIAWILLYSICSDSRLLEICTWSE